MVMVMNGRLGVYDMHQNVEEPDEGKSFISGFEDPQVG
jgi:hypothetical protein